jgi:membrane peptidoglycan carboxypeptidase
LHYAQGTPYETILHKAPDQGKRIFAPEIAKVARGAMVGVVNGGTASRLNGIYTDAGGKLLSVGGKTGTGDHRKQAWGAGGRLLESKFISRAATFTFFLGDRFFGVITAYVEGDNAGLYHFTSSLPVQIVKFLKPTLTPLINNTLPANGEMIKPVANVIISENVKPVIINTEKVKPLVKKATVKVTKPKVKEMPVKVVKPLDKPATAKATMPLVKEAAPKVIKPLAKVTKSPVPVKEATAKATKPLVKEETTRISTTDKNDSATRYYKYPIPPKPFQ